MKPEIKQKIMQLVKSENQEEEEEVKVDIAIVSLPDRPIYIREMQQKYKDEWPLDLSKCTQPPSIQFLPDDWAKKIPAGVVEKAGSSEVTTCA